MPIYLKEELYNHQTFVNLVIMMDNGSIMDKALGNQNPVPISQDPSDIVFMFLLKNNSRNNTKISRLKSIMSSSK